MLSPSHIYTTSITVKCRIVNQTFLLKITYASASSTYMGNIHTPKSFNYFLSTAPSSNPLLPAVVSLSVVVLLLITCVALLVLALAVTATKLNKLRAEKGRTDPHHYYDQTGGGEGKTMEGIYDEVGEGTCTIGGHYQELKLGTMEKRHYAAMHGEGHQC